MGRDHPGTAGKRVNEQGVLCGARNTGKRYYYWLRKVREAAAEAGPQLVRLEEKREKAKTRVIEIRYGDAELKLPEDVDLEAVSVLQNALRSHD